MATMTQAYHSDHAERLSTKRIIIGVVLFIALLLTAWAVRVHTSHVAAPANSTTQTNPNVQQNVPPTRQANQGGSSNQDTVPSSNGTNGVQGAGR